MDNTFATPYVQRPVEFGADVVVHSTTKCLNGHSDAMGGAVLTDDPSPTDAVERTQSYDLGGSESLVDHPATVSASYLSDAERSAAGISDSLVRIAVGVEHVDDPRGDLDRALENV